MFVFRYVLYCTTINNLKMSIKKTKKKTNESFKEIEKFNSWMIDKIKSIHYSNHIKMLDAYKKIT